MVQNHSAAFSKNRHGRFRESGTFRWVFDQVQCVPAWQPGLVKGEGFAVDASIIEAEATSKLAMPEMKLMSGRTRHCASAPCASIWKGWTTKYRGNHPQAHFARRPQSSWTAAPGGPAFFAYSTNYLIDVAHGVILDVEATPAHRTAEVE